MDTCSPRISSKYSFLPARLRQPQYPMTNLSFAAQEVYDAFICTPVEFSDKKALAAAIRAAVLCCKRDQLQLLAIADELEGN
jgi:hypothetical protein